MPSPPPREPKWADLPNWSDLNWTNRASTPSPHDFVEEDDDQVALGFVPLPSQNHHQDSVQRTRRQDRQVHHQMVRRFAGTEPQNVAGNIDRQARHNLELVGRVQNACRELLMLAATLAFAVFVAGLVAVAVAAWMIGGSAKQ